jgi:hypothetical protein
MIIGESFCTTYLKLGHLSAWIIYVEDLANNLKVVFNNGATITAI